VTTFKGWPVEAVEFFEGLEADNTKTYWQANRAAYDDQVLAPMAALMEDLTSEFGPGRVYRPYRDVRFSRDKRPYKTSIAASNSGGYISLSADALGVGSGLYMPDAITLERFRAAVADDTTGTELEKLVAGLAGKGMEMGAHETLKTAPRGYPKDHPRIDLLRCKGLTAWKQWPVGSWLGTAMARKRIVEALHNAVPLNQWLAENVVTGS
jgi:uncharacterized protein (TIGR02453 family)